ncbi:GIY-YIG nuclease family protein [Nocardia higoensis]|uniref:GIY-YIG nuclease family protein n=1 Tax=Nocardia higoensis TaxID=228599 RepID=A0ABS0D559_9NOCA|nr:GIY-YIG nuclease family protein [Nocardia higoensis]
MTGRTTGFVYILTNKKMPGLVKIGMTGRLIGDRVRELYNTSVPVPFEVPPHCWRADYQLSAGTR